MPTIDSRVTDVENEPVIGAILLNDGRSRHGGTGMICRLQHVLHFFGGDLKTLVDLRGGNGGLTTERAENVHHYLACDVTGLIAAHPVSHQKNGWLRQDRVLIDRPYAPAVCCYAPCCAQWSPSSTDFRP